MLKVESSNPCLSLFRDFRFANNLLFSREISLGDQSFEFGRGEARTATATSIFGGRGKDLSTNL